MSPKNSLLLLVVALAVGYSPAAAETLKCGASITVPGYEPGPMVVLVDGVVLHHPFFEEFDTGDVGWAEGLCWDPRSGRFSKLKGGVGVMMVKTKTFMESPELMAEHDAKARKAMQELWDEATGGFGGWTEGQ